MKTQNEYSEEDVLIVLQNFAKDQDLSSGLVVKNWYMQWLKEHPPQHKNIEQPEPNVFKYKVEIDGQVFEIEKDVQFLFYNDIKNLFLKRGSITNEDKWNFYVFCRGIEPDIKLDEKFILDLNLNLHPRFFSVGKSIFNV